MEKVSEMKTYIALSILAILSAVVFCDSNEKVLENFKLFGTSLAMSDLERIEPCFFQNSCACLMNTKTGEVDRSFCEIYDTWPSFANAMNKVDMEELLMKGNFSTIPSRAFEGFRAIDQIQIFISHYMAQEPLTFHNDAFLPSLPQYLKQLVIQYGELDTIPQALQTLSNLKVLNIQRTSLPTISDYAFQAQDQSLHSSPRLNMLIISRSALTTIQPRAFAGQELSLTTLDLSYNAMAGFPKDAISRLSVLEQLSLQQNQITELPFGVFQSLQKLRIINLAQNRISSLHENIFFGLETNKIQLLDISKNRLEQIPTSLAQLRELESLNLRSNYITSVGPEIFSNASGLLSLDLAFNPLTTVAPGTFRGLESLSVITLSNTKLKTLDLNAFDGCHAESVEIIFNGNLETITMEDKQNQELFPETIALLNISSNAFLKEIPSSIEQLLKNRSNMVLDLRHNLKFHCTCAIEWMNQFVGSDLRSEQLLVGGSVCDNQPYTLNGYLHSLRENPHACASSTTQKVPTTDLNDTRNGSNQSTPPVQNISLVTSIILMIIACLWN